jgi:hypothetical protein
MLLFVITLASGLIQQSVAVHAAPSSQNYSLFLPLASGAASTGGNPGGNPGGTPQSPSGALVLGDGSYRSADIAVDKSGGMHVVFSRIAPLSYAGEPKPTYYAYCPGTNLAACAKREGWTTVALSNDMFFAQLELTPNGKPRILLHNDSYYINNIAATVYQYAECDQNCTSSQGWKVIDIGTTKTGSVYSTDYNANFFKLDPYGRPRMIYNRGQDYSVPGRTTTSWYMRCDANCTDINNWLNVLLPQDYSQLLYRATLAFTPDGLPRFITWMPLSDSYYVVYVECSNTCEQTSDWSEIAPLIKADSGPGHRSWGFQIDTLGRPRLVVKPTSEPLVYAWCDNSCASSESWNGYALPLDTQDGQHPSLALDSQNRPRIAYKEWNQSGLGYLWCEANCETNNASWKNEVVETATMMNSSIRPPSFPGCPTGTWIGGYRTVLTLDAQDNPRIAYDGEMLMQCYKNIDRPQDGTYTEAKWWTSRFVFFPQPK